jgi:NADH-quinone oxidoreductase subunit C
MTDLSVLATHIEAKFPVSHSMAFGELTIHAQADNIVSVLQFLRDDPECRFVAFVDLTAADYPEREKRFDVVYHLLSPYKNHRIRVKVHAGETDVVPSALPVFMAANWFEREVFDLYGIMFSGHPDLRRILTDYGFQGHPLRKDFPTTGYVEVRYDDEAKRVVYEPVKLVQEFRQFDYLSPWEGTNYVLPGDEKVKQS